MPHKPITCILNLFQNLCQFINLFDKFPQLLQWVLTLNHVKINFSITQLRQTYSIVINITPDSLSSSCSSTGCTTSLLISSSAPNYHLRKAWETRWTIWGMQHCLFCTALKSSNSLLEHIIFYNSDIIFTSMIAHDPICFGKQVLAGGSKEVIFQVFPEWVPLKLTKSHGQACSTQFLSMKWL